MSFTDRKRHIASKKDIGAKWGSGSFGCMICGHNFQENDGYRWIYANAGNGPFRYGNFFVCDNCDQGDDICLKTAADLINQMKGHPIIERLCRNCQ